MKLGPEETHRSLVFKHLSLQTLESSNTDAEQR